MLIYLYLCSLLIPLIVFQLIILKEENTIILRVMTLKGQKVVGIMVDRRDSRKRIASPYIKYSQANIKIFAFTPKDVLWKEKRILGLTFQNGVWIEKKMPFPNVVHNRCYSRSSVTLHRLEKYIGKNKCFNIVTAFNKWTLHTILSTSEFHSLLPQTFLYGTKDITEFIKEHNILFLKPIHGSRGISVYRLQSMPTNEINISMHSIAPTYICRAYENIQEKLVPLIGVTPYLVQQGIQMKPLDGQQFDMRVLVQKNIQGIWTVSSTVSRITHPDYFNTSACQSVHMTSEILPRLYPHVTVAAIIQTLHDASIKIAALVERSIGLLGELCIDFALDTSDKIWIIELNGRPQKSIYSEIAGFPFKQQIYGKPIEYAYFLSTSSGH